MAYQWYVSCICISVFVLLLLFAWLLVCVCVCVCVFDLFVCLFVSSVFLLQYCVLIHSFILALRLSVSTVLSTNKQTNEQQLNMQAVFLISDLDYTEKQIGLLFLVFGLSQFLFMAPVGYILDYSRHKLAWVIYAGVACAALTVLTTLTAQPDGTNLHWMLLIKFCQGACTAVLPPGFNAITMGIVGTKGFTHQVSRNRMMNHVGTALVVAIGSLIAYCLFPNIAALFVVSPIAAAGVWYHLRQVIPQHVHRDAARLLIMESPTMTEYELADDVAAAKQQAAVLLLERTTANDNTREKKQRSSGGSTNNSASSSNSNPVSGSGSGGDCEVVLASTPAPSEVNGTRTRYVNSSVANDNSNNNTSPTSGQGNNYYRPPTDILHTGLEPPSSSNNISTTAQQSSMPSSGGHHVMTADFHDDDDHVIPKNRNVSSLERKSSPKSYSSMPSFRFGWNGSGGISSSSSSSSLREKQLQDKKDSEHYMPKASGGTHPRTPLSVLMNSNLMVFTIVIFFYHLSNSSVLPLVMQSLALRDPQAGILLSGLCIVLAQGLMSFFAKWCGDFSPYWGRKKLILVGLISLTIRCFFLTLLLSAEETVETLRGQHVIKAMILSTQFLDAVGAGILGTLQILVTSDLSGGTGRFSLLMGVTTAAMCLGATISGYLGQALAQDYGYPFAFTALGLLSLIPFCMYVFFMPETLPSHDRKQTKKRRRRLRELLRRLNEQRKRILRSKKNPFQRQKDTVDNSFTLDLAKSGNDGVLV